MKKDSLEIDLGKGLKLIISPHTEGALCFDETDAADYGESRWQLQEGREYEYEFVESDSSNDGVDARFEDLPGIIVPRKNKKYEGSIKTGLYVGSLKLAVVNSSGTKIDTVCFEIQSIKTDYRSDYRTMLGDITEYYTDLVMLQGSPVSQKFEVDNDASPQTLYQKFAFVKSIVDSDAFEESVHKIIQNPVRKWRQTTVTRHIENVRRIGRNGVRQILSRADRIPFDGVQGLDSIPRTLDVLDKCDTVDTFENQFVKYVLTQFYGFCSDIASKKNASERLKAEANATCNVLLKFVGLPFFKDISMPQHINLNSPVLQRKEGYREILQGWLIFDLAAKLGWSGGDNVYEAGKRNVAALYEYWLFFKLLEIISDLFKINPEEKCNLIQKDKDGLNLEIKQGKMKMISGVSDVGGRNINIRFYYNRTFGHRKELNESGSWTVPMRPDYTLSMWPGNIDEAEADRLASIGKIVEMRAYNTVHGVWKYMTVEDESLDVSKGNFLVIGTPESFRQCREHFGEGVMVPVLVTVDDGARLERALKRERKQANPKYEEMCRRFLADAKDFSAEKLAEAGIDSSFENVDLETCYKEIAAFIKANLE